MSEGQGREASGRRGKKRGKRTAVTPSKNRSFRSKMNRFYEIRAVWKIFLL